MYLFVMSEFELEDLYGNLNKSDADYILAYSPAIGKKVTIRKNMVDYNGNEIKGPDGYPLPNVIPYSYFELPYEDESLNGLSDEEIYQRWVEENDIIVIAAEDIVEDPSYFRYQAADPGYARHRRRQ